MPKEYKIFRREAVAPDKRVRWHHISTRTATSRTDALRKFFGPGRKVAAGEQYSRWLTRPEVVTASEDGWISESGDVYVPNRANSVPDWNGVPVLAWESGTVDFEHYNYLGTFVPAV